MQRQFLSGWCTLIGPKNKEISRKNKNYLWLNLGDITEGLSCSFNTVCGFNIKAPVTLPADKLDHWASSERETQRRIRRWRENVKHTSHSLNVFVFLCLHISMGRCGRLHFDKSPMEMCELMPGSMSVHSSAQ